MTKPINEYTINELSAKIEAIKAEREKTANALKKYEEELERRKQEVPLGVPQDGKFFVHSDYCVGERFGLFSCEYMKYNCFPSEESAQKHAEMLLAWRKALVANSKGEPIDIQALLPLLPKGKVFFSTNLHLWVWTKEEPKKGQIGWICRYSTPLSPLNIKPAENWETSLLECGI